MLIEKAQPEDLDEILSLQKMAYQSEAALCNDYLIPPLTQTLDGLIEDYRKMLILKAVEKDQIIGSVRAYVEEGVCRIGRLIVHPDHQNKGIGRLLMDSVEEHFSGCKKYSLFTGKQSIKNLYFYNQLGYKIVGEDQLNERVTIVLLEKENSLKWK
jgi:GNAT superfamily N-acetyltransferase